MESGTISAEEFVVLAQEFESISTATGDNWTLDSLQVAGKDELYLTKKAIHLLNIENDVLLAPEEFEIEEGSCIAPCENDQNFTICNFDYHIVHSCSYSVPVLYFNAYKENGQLLSLEELWNSLPEEHKPLETERWSFITQQEHPLLHRPFFQLHPCHTNDLMKLFNHSTSVQSDNYLVTWLSSVGPVVHLKLSLEYANKNLKSAIT